MEGQQDHQGEHHRQMSSGDAATVALAFECSGADRYAAIPGCANDRGPGCAVSSCNLGAGEDEPLFIPDEGQVRISSQTGV